MSGKFVCKLPGGFDVPSGEHIEPGNRYDTWAYSDDLVAQWEADGWIERVD